MPVANITRGGTYPNCTINLNPAVHQNGTSTITVNVSDGALTGTDTFVLTVVAVNDTPTISNVADQTTAEDMGTLFSMIYDCANYGSGLMTAYPNGEYTQTECKQMLELMSANDLLRLLQGGIPKGVRIAHKNGWVSDMTGDAGIVFPPNGRDYAIAVYLWQKTDFQDFTKLWPMIEDISRAACR